MEARQTQEELDQNPEEIKMTTAVIGCNSIEEYFEGHCPKKQCNDLCQDFLASVIAASILICLVYLRHFQ